MRIGIDVRYLSHGLMGGVHTFVAELVPAVVRIAPDHHFYLYADYKNTFELTDLPANVTVRLLPYRSGLSSIRNDIQRMRAAMASDRVDVAHFPANYGFAPAGVPSVITLHDQINVLPLREIIRGHSKRLKTIVMMTYLHFLTTRAVARAIYIVTVSEYSRQNILRAINFDPQRVLSYPHGIPKDVHNESSESVLNEVRSRYQLDKPFAIADAVKNPAALVAAWENLLPEIRDQHQIVFFSRTPSPPDAVMQAVESGYARLIVRPSNEELRALYTLARVFTFPSWIEGFGFPILEAMACGTPVIASDRGSIPEVVGEAGLLCDVDDVDAFARNLTTVLTDPAEHERLRQLGYQRAQQFSWDKTAQAYLDIYERAYRG
jgi:glycosyltransferase involved in cell wall biosynthesis